MREIFSGEKNEKRFLEEIERLMNGVEKRRKKDLMSNVLFYHMMRSTEYFSKFVDLKQQIRQAQQGEKGKKERD